METTVTEIKNVMGAINSRFENGGKNIFKNLKTQ